MVSLRVPAVTGPLYVTSPPFLTLYPILHEQGEVVWTAKKPGDVDQREFRMDARLLNDMPASFVRDIDPHAEANARAFYAWSDDATQHVVGLLYDARDSHPLIQKHAEVAYGQASGTALQMLGNGELCMKRDATNAELPLQSEWIRKETMRIFTEKARTAMVMPNLRDDGTRPNQYVRFMQSVKFSQYRKPGRAQPRYRVPIFGPDGKEVDRHDSNVQVVFPGAVGAVKFIVQPYVSESYYGVRFRMQNVRVWDQGLAARDPMQGHTEYDPDLLKPMEVPSESTRKRPRVTEEPTDAEMTTALQQAEEQSSTFVSVAPMPESPKQVNGGTTADKDD